MDTSPLSHLLLLVLIVDLKKIQNKIKVPMHASNPDLYLTYRVFKPNV